MALLLPKLRSHFAEFLRESSLAPLSILYSPTCVGFGYRDTKFNTINTFLATILTHTQLMPLPIHLGRAYLSWVPIIAPLKPRRNIHLLAIDYAIRFALGPG